MKNNNGVSRRNFIRQTSLGIGGGIIGAAIPSCKENTQVGNYAPARKVCIATVDLKGLWPEKTREARIKNMLERMEKVVGLNPDIVCLPELFDTTWVDEQKTLAEVAEDQNVPGPVTSRVAEFAKKHNCYVICPVYTKKDGHFYNSSLLVDRKGGIAGVYNKIHPVKSELIDLGQDKTPTGLMSGAVDQPVIETDFGKVGMQICYDANWTDGWDNLKKKGAEIIFFSSAFPGGRMLNYYAWKNNCYIVSSSGQDARVIDMSGITLDTSSTFVRFAWATVNLEKVNADTWPTNERLQDLFNKYGNRIKIKVWDETGVITIESMDSGLKVRDVIKEFGIQTIDENVKISELAQDKYRI